MKRITFAIVILLMVMLSACGGAPSSNAATSSPPTPMYTPLPDDAYVSTKCVSIDSAPPADLQLNGIAVLGDYKSTSNVFMQNLGNETQSLLPTSNQSVATVAVSPDRTQLAYELSSNGGKDWNLVVANANGKVTDTFPWKQGFFNLGYWVNNQQILIIATPPFEVVNPFTKEEKAFTYQDLPGYAADAIGNRYAGFSPDMTQAVYKNNDGSISLLDLTTKKILGEVKNPLSPSVISDWTTDGSQVAVVGNPTTSTSNTKSGDDIFSMTREGQVKQLTHLADHYGKNLLISSSGIRWSPNGRYIAFWFIYAEPQWELAVYDTTTKKTTDYCIPNLYSSSLNFRPLPPPVWSPDGTQLMVENRYDKSNNHVVILDINRGIAFQIGDNEYPIGWLVPGNSR